MHEHNSHQDCCGQPHRRLGVVSYLNARPLIYGLEREPAVRLCFDVPARLCERLITGDVDAALIPVIDLHHYRSDIHIISDACIGCDGETLTVRIFSRVPTERIRRIHVDAESRTSVVLAKLLWPNLYRTDVEFVPLSSPPDDEACEAVLLIGDKVVSTNTDPFRYQIDLGGAWKAWSGLPFVFAVWAAPRCSDAWRMRDLLSGARNRGVARAGQIAVEFGPAHGWPTALAQQYLQRYLRYELTDKHAEGMVRFLDLAAARNLVSQPKERQSA